MSLRKLTAIIGLHLTLTAIFSGGCSHEPPAQELGEGSVKLENKASQFQSTVDRHLRPPNSPFVYISWFPNPSTEELAQINASGAGVRGWVRSGGAVGPLLLVRLDPVGLYEVRDLLKQAPPSFQNVPQHSAVLLTYHDESGFHTRVYDRFQIPTTVHRMWHVMAAPGMAMDCGPAPTAH